MVDFSQIYKATYSGIPVYEMNCKGVAVMRRRADSYLNATQILKVADFDKPQRTRILEREVQIGQHEKVQGGYGKYQGTWVPFERAKKIAELYNVDKILAPILEFVKGDESPPLAPKHLTAASTRPRKSREPRRQKKVSPVEDSDVETIPAEEPSSPLKRTRTSKTNHKIIKPRPTRSSEALNKNNSNSSKSEEKAPDLDPKKEDRLVDATNKSQENDDTEEGEGETDKDGPLNESTYAQKLLQYFMSSKTTVPPLLNKPPRDLDLNVIIDEEGHTSLHWAAAMARIKVVKLLIEQGADIYRVNYKGQTALMRSVLFTNNFDHKTFDSLVDILRTTIFNIDKKDQTVFHHAAAMSDWKGKIYASRYYIECLIHKLKSNQSELISILNVQDVHGDTALTIAAKIGNRRLIQLLIDAGASTDIVNEDGMAPKDYLSEMEKSMISRQNDSPPLLQGSTSPGDIRENTPRINESDTRELLRARVETMFKNIANDPTSAPPISEVFDDFAESYERDLTQKERLLYKKKIELDLHTKRLDETKRVLDSVGLDDDEEIVQNYIQNVENQGQTITNQYKKWLQYSQKFQLQLLTEQNRLDQQKKPPSPPLQTNLDELKLMAQKLKDEIDGLEKVRKEKIEKLIQLRCNLPPKRHQDYKRLISTSCNVAYENVDMMLAPLLASFESENNQSNQ